MRKDKYNRKVMRYSVEVSDGSESEEEEVEREVQEDVEARFLKGKIWQVVS